MGELGQQSLPGVGGCVGDPGARTGPDRVTYAEDSNSRRFTNFKLDCVTYIHGDPNSDDIANPNSFFVSANRPFQ